MMSALSCVFVLLLKIDAYQTRLRKFECLEFYIGRKNSIRKGIDSK